MATGTGFNRYAAGSKIYGGGRSFPTMGPVNGREGYRERDLEAKTKRNALLRRIQAGQRGRYMSADFLRGR